MNEENSTQNITVEGASVEYIKLVKKEAARTGNIAYNWEIKQLSLNIEELEKINNELLKKFGSQQDGN